MDLYKMGLSTSTPQALLSKTSTWFGSCVVEVLDKCQDLLREGIGSSDTNDGFFRIPPPLRKQCLLGMGRVAQSCLPPFLPLPRQSQREAGLYETQN